MRVKSLRALACLGVLILGVTLAIGCTGATKHFEESGISFDYSSTWKVEESDDPARIAYLSEVETSTIVQVMKSDLPAGFALKDWHDSMAMALMTGQPISGNPLTVAGVAAYETVFDAQSGNQDIRFRWVSLEKDGVVYDIAFATVPESFDTVNKDFDTVINSFQVQ
jgi:hypothetical protein